MNKSEFAPTAEDIAEEKQIKANREIIIKSLETIKFQTSRNLCQNTGLSIDDVLYHTKYDLDITSQHVGAFEVYYLKSNAPKGRLFNTGNNHFDEVPAEVEPEDAEKMKACVVSAETVRRFALDGKSQKQLAWHYNIGYSTVWRYFKDFPALREAWDAGNAERKLKSVGEKYTKPSPTRDKMDLTVIEESAAKGLSQNATANLLGINPGTFIYYLNSKKESDIYRQAWKRGIERRGEKPEASAEKVQASALDHKLAFDAEAAGDYVGSSKYADIPVTPEEDEAFDEMSKSDKLDKMIDDHYNEEFEQWKNSEQNRELSRPHSETSFGQELEIIASEFPLPIAQDVAKRFLATGRVKEKVLDKLTDFSVSIPPVPTHYKSIKLSNGKTVSIASDINVFEANAKERDFLNKLTELMQKFEGTV